MSNLDKYHVPVFIDDDAIVEMMRGNTRSNSFMH